MFRVKMYSNSTVGGIRVVGMEMEETFVWCLLIWLNG